MMKSHNTMSEREVLYACWRIWSAGPTSYGHKQAEASAVAQRLNFQTLSKNCGIGYMYACPCCEWVSEELNLFKLKHEGKVHTTLLKPVAKCGQCPLWDLWLMESETDMETADYSDPVSWSIPCERVYGSPYNKWQVNADGLNDYDCKFFALLIAEECKRLLQEVL